MKKNLLLFLLLLGSSLVPARELSDSAFASLITCGPGNDFYTTFGHTALRICDPAQKADVVFNYGTFDFSTPHFYAKFARGILQYQLSASSYTAFMAEYIHDGRAVTEQRLLLTHEELEKLFDALCVNFLPKNRYYAYDFFIDNCATRVRDQIENSLIGRHFYRTERGNLTFRQLLHPPMEGKLEWWKFGIDLVLGARCDRKATTFQYMFLPAHLCTQTDTGHIQGSNCSLAEPQQQLLEDHRKSIRNSLPPWMVFTAIFLLYIPLTIYELRRQQTSRLGRTADALLYSATFALSLLIVFLWFFTEHYCTKWNLNLLWANPLFLLMLFRKRGGWLPRLLAGCCIIALLMGIVRWPQQLPFAALPLIGTLLLRLCAGMRTIQLKTRNVNSSGI